MEFWLAIAALARRPRVFVPTLLLGLSMGAAAFLVVPATYVSSATMVLTTTEFGGTESQDPSAPTELVNPLLTFTDSLRTSADMLIWSMSSSDVKRFFESEPPVELTVNDGRSNPDLLGFNGPVVYVTGRSTDAQRARDAVDRASAMMRQELFEWQETMKAPSSTYITMVDVVPTTPAEAEHGSRLKLAALGLLAGIFSGIAGAYAWMRVRARGAVGPTGSKRPPPVASSPAAARPGPSEPSASAGWSRSSRSPGRGKPSSRPGNAEPPAPSRKGKKAAPVGAGSK